MDGQRGVCKLLWQDRGWILGRLATRAALFGLARCVGNAPCAREASIQWHAFACSMAHCATRLMCCCFDLGARTARRAAPVLRAASDTPAGLSWWSGARAACLNCPRSWGHGAYRRSPLRPLRPLSPPACAPAGTTSRSEAPTHWSASWMRRSGSCKSLPTSTCLWSELRRGSCPWAELACACEVSCGCLLTSTSPGRELWVPANSSAKLCRVCQQLIFVLKFLRRVSMHSEFFGCHWQGGCSCLPIMLPLYLGIYKHV